MTIYLLDCDTVNRWMWIGVRDDTIRVVFSSPQSYIEHATISQAHDDFRHGIPYCSLFNSRHSPSYA